MTAYQDRDDRRLTTRRHAFACPYCAERISMLLDMSVEFQRYIEDCEVCCNPIEIVFHVEEGTLDAFEARML